MRLSFITMLSALLLAVPLLAQEDEPEPMKTATEAMAYANGLESLSFDLEIRMQADTSDDAEPFRGTIVLGGEDSLFIHVEEAGEAAELYSDGKTKFIYIASEKLYIEDDVKENRAQLIGLLGEGPLRVGTLWLGGFLHNKSNLLEDVTGAEYLGEQKLREDGPATRHLRLNDASFDVDLWLASGEKPLLQQVVFDFARALDEAPADPDEARIQFNLTDWKTNFDPPAETFTFSPPEGVVSYAEKMAERNKDALLGKEAPQLALPLLGGGDFDLAAHKGKQVVVLDFWATWCGPCRMALPIVDKLAQEFKDKDVAFYAVNLREEEERVQQFVDAQKLTLPVALDAKGEASEKYNVSSIPRMVIVGKDGIVRGGHQGVAPNMESQLRKELDELLGEAAEKE